MRWADYLSIIGIIISIIGIIISIIILMIGKRNLERKRIIEIIKYFLEPAKRRIEKDKDYFENLNSSFPEFLGHTFGKFPKKVPLLKRKISKYHNLCLGINRQINELKEMAEKEEIIETVVTNEILEVDLREYDHKIVISDKYENKDPNKILKEKGLYEKIKSIENHIKELALDKQSEKLIGEMNGVKEKFKDKYCLTDEELET
jgi:hypothetical protein